MLPLLNLPSFNLYLTIRAKKDRIARLYDQGAGAVSIGQYVRRWLQWELAGLGKLWRWVLASMGELCSGWKEEIKKAGAMMPLPEVRGGMSGLFLHCLPFSVSSKTR